ncbi:uncharacterized protein LOC127284206 [Leptopilina boulardi]|uniref:uncharacterized protein LOC127284206 n=1 Tax=Leptopilina boulardi TaxID=63433 RepID=UPI0021F67D84|nr:uncharacterized protein LOC127284206 [Leptopilina boulardi]
MGPFEILCIIAGIFLLLYFYSTSTHDFWKNKNVKGPKPTPLLGNFTDLMLNRISMGDYTKKLYEQFNNELMIGMFARKTPILLLKDPNLIKDVLIKDFNKFADRGINISEKVDVLSPHLFALEPERWRPLRKKLSPVFTSGKLKEMFHLLIETSEHLEEYLNNIVIENEPIECRKLTAKFTTDVIGSCAFGIDINALSNEESEFLRMGRKIFDLNFWRTLKIRIRDITPWLYELLGPILAEKEMNNFFVNLVRDTMKYRKENNIVRHDFIDLLREVKENPDKLSDIELTDSLIAAQAFVFFIAGFETSSTTMSNALYELALNPSIQEKLRKEIQNEFKITEGKLLYDRIKNLKYLHMVFQETLRKYPPVTVLMRKATEKYTFSDTNVTIPKGQKIWIPTYAIQRDPKNYPNPDTFDPERFSEEEEELRHPMLFLPFGDGPRNCIGARFAVYQTKIGLMKILNNYKVDVCEKTCIPYVNSKNSFLLQPKDGIYLKFKKIVFVQIANKNLIKITNGKKKMLFEILCLIVGFIFLYYYSRKNFDFWKKQGVKCPTPIPFVGNFKDFMLNRISIGDFTKQVYDQFENESMVGFYARRKPILLIRDPKLIKNILIKDFNKFADRGMTFHEKVDILSPNLFMIEPKRWRPLRKKLSPVFTSGKLKEMFHLLIETSEHLEEYLNKIVIENEPIECRKLTTKFTIDVIGSCVFGIDINSLSNENNHFIKMGQIVFKANFWKNFKMRMREITPGLYNFFGSILAEREMDNFFVNLVRDTMKYRKENNIVRHDFIDLLREVKENPDQLGDLELTDSLIAAQAFVFFVAGFETSSTTMSNALYELALNPLIQEKVRKEIQNELKITEGKFLYDRIKNLKYLHMIFQETLRLYPPITVLMRKTTEKYTFLDNNVTLEKGYKVWIPIYAIHRDGKYHSEPEIFNPDRFKDEEINLRNPMHYLPFGDGPRNCIGSRFAIYQTKIGLMQILKSYRVDVCEKTSIPYVNHRSSFLLQPRDGIYLKFKTSIKIKTIMLFEIFFTITIIILIFHFKNKSNNDFWKIRGIKGPESRNFFVTMKNIFLTKTYIGDTIKKMYDDYKDEKMIGMFAGSMPILIIKDPELIKDILIKDFNKFADRGIRLHEKVNPLSAHLFSLEPKRWRPLRKCLSPVFTSGKLKEMFYLILKSSENLELYLKKIVTANKIIECRSVTAKFTTDVIGSCAFGIDVNAFVDENNNEFLRMGKKIFDVGYWRTLKMQIMRILPNLYDRLGFIVSDREMDDFFVNLIKNTIQYRKENNIIRHDFVDILRNMKENSKNLENIELTDNLLAAQANVFFAAGFETSSTTMSNCLYELALNPLVQEKLQKEICEILQNSGNELSYENVKNMKYLHQVFQETLRKYPPVPFLMRCSLDEYTISDTNVKIPKGQRVWIPAYAIQRDPKNYPNPDKFDPERFSEEEEESRHPMLFLPFGDGPRNCIGARFAVYQTKVGLIKILNNYNVDVCEKTCIPYVNNKNSFLLQPTDGIYLKFKKII